ncbi:hypothetical protein VP01_253g4 [Puccinia sorghi]|uniref:Uncharacterized protein n=1 Tax=Puccinia sorghi TaxID=27349 RepID=A0A0L6V5E3_9BASI|nr:hypothetical protein VP01_253g4 [Puccinia sorghi]
MLEEKCIQEAANVFFVKLLNLESTKDALIIGQASFGSRPYRPIQTNLLDAVLNLRSVVFTSFLFLADPCPTSLYYKHVLATFQDPLYELGQAGFAGCALHSIYQQGSASSEHCATWSAKSTNPRYLYEPGAFSSSSAPSVVLELCLFSSSLLHSLPLFIIILIMILSSIFYQSRLLWIIVIIIDSCSTSDFLDTSNFLPFPHHLLNQSSEDIIFHFPHLSIKCCTTQRQLYTRLSSSSLSPTQHNVAFFSFQDNIILCHKVWQPKLVPKEKEKEKMKRRYVWWRRQIVLWVDLNEISVSMKHTDILRRDEVLVSSKESEGRKR